MWKAKEFAHILQHDKIVLKHFNLLVLMKNVGVC